MICNVFKDLQDFPNIEDVFERTQLSVRKKRTQTKSISCIKKQSLKSGRPVGRPKASRNAEETANKRKNNNDFENAIVPLNCKIEQTQNFDENSIIKSNETETITDEETCRVKTELNISLKQPKREPAENTKDSGKFV